MGACNLILVWFSGLHMIDVLLLISCCMLSEMSPTLQGVAVMQCLLGWRIFLSSGIKLCLPVLLQNKIFQCKKFWTETKSAFIFLSK
jgi:hypothetical protein